MTTSKEYKIRHFQHHNIIKHLDPYDLNQIKEEIEKDIISQSINTNNIKINSGSEFSIKSYTVKGLLVPNANFTLIKDHMIQSYKALKFAKNFDKITKVFLISFSYGAIDPKFYISSYSAYETIFKKVYNINTKIYDLFLERTAKVRKYIQMFEKHTYINTIFTEENQIIKETNEEITELVEDSEFSFDIHLIFLNIILGETRKVEIIPIWINSSNTENMSILADALDTYLQDEGSIFIFSTNVTYFGRMYNFFGDNKFKSKSFLKEAKNEKEIRDFLTTLDDNIFEAFKQLKMNTLTEASNLLYTRNVFMFALEIYKRLYEEKKFDVEKLYYNAIRQENNNDSNDYEINLVSLMSLIFLSSLSN